MLKIYTDEEFITETESRLINNFIAVQGIPKNRTQKAVRRVLAENAAIAREEKRKQKEMLTRDHIAEKRAAALELDLSYEQYLPSSYVINPAYLDAPSKFPRFDTSFPHSPGFYQASLNNKYYIYVLVDCSDDTVRYVGKTNDLARRLVEHRKGLSFHNYALHNWKIAAKFKLIVVDRAAEQNWQQAERAWIKYYRRKGRIYNIHKGGGHGKK